MAQDLHGDDPSTRKLSIILAEADAQMAKKLGVSKRDKDRPNTEALPNPWAPPKPKSSSLGSSNPMGMFSMMEQMRNAPDLNMFREFQTQFGQFGNSSSTSSQSLPPTNFLNTMASSNMQAYPPTMQPFQAPPQAFQPIMQQTTQQIPQQTAEYVQERYSSQLEQLRQMGFTVILN